MKVRIADIPQEGLELEFKVNLQALNERLATSDSANAKNAFALNSKFDIEPNAKVRLELEGRTVMFNAQAKGQFSTDCSRCLERSTCEIKSDIKLVLKPIRERESEQDKLEDLNFGSYDGKEIDCSQIAEEYLVIALPQVVLCSKDCKGLCAICGENMNFKQCNCKTETAFVDERFSVLKGLKIH